MAQLKAYVHLAYGIDAEKYRHRYEAGEVPDKTPYGFHHAESMDWEVIFSQDNPESRLTRLLRKVGIRVLGFDLLHAWRNRVRIGAADIVWTMEEIEYLAVCALPLLIRTPRPRLIAQTIWLLNHWASASTLRRGMLRRLMARADVLTFHSAQYLPLLPRLAPGLKGHLLPFGISLDSFPWAEPKLTSTSGGVLRVLSMGNDPTRDWPTLLSAFGNDARFELQVVSGRLTDNMAAGYRNLTCPRNPTMQAFRELYRWADLVIVPMVPNLYSGITVALEATSLGLPVISSRTGGVPTYFNADQVCYVEPNDAKAMRAAALALSPADRHDQAVRAQAHFRAEDYSSRGMAQRYVELSAAVLEGRWTNG